MVYSLAKFFFVGLGLSAIWVVPLINLLYRLRFIFQREEVKGWNDIFVKITKSKVGTPSLGGILIWITITFIWGFLIDNPFSRAAAVMFFVIGLFGFVEELFTVFVIRRSKKLRIWYDSVSARMLKAGAMLLVYIIATRIALGFLGISRIHIFGYTVPLVFSNPFVQFIVWVLVTVAFFVASYGTEIIDGIDALAAGLFIITLWGYVLLSFAFPKDFILFGNTYMTSMLGALIGVLLVYLYFNIPPARVFMGSPGALPMGAFFLLVSMYTDTMEAFLFFIAIYVIDFATSVLQLLSLKFRKKRIFPIAPIHHYFQHKGWPDAKVTMRAYVVQIIMVMLGVLVQIIVRRGI